MKLKRSKMWTALLFLLFIFGCTAKESSEIEELRYEFITMEKNLWEVIVEQSNNAIHQDVSPEMEIIKNFQDFGDSLQHHVPEDITDGVEVLANIWIWAKAYTDLRNIYAMYEHFRRFQKLQTGEGRIPSPKQAWVDLAETILKDAKNSVPASFDKILDHIHNGNLFREALTEIVFHNCESKQSPNQVLYNLYRSVAITQLKGYMMIQYSYMIMNVFNMGNYSEIVINRRHAYEQKAKITADNAKMSMIKASRQLWTCDPKEHKKDVTYTEVSQLVQAYLENEVDMNDKSNCFQNCAYYEYTTSKGCYMNQFCNKQKRCNGKILNCKFVASDMTVCQAPRNSGRRYEYIEYDNGKVYGRKLGCSRGTTRVESWWRYLFWHCSYCLCLCDEEGPASDRYFSLRPVTSNVNENYVVTGIRFVKVNKVIHLQISEGKLGSFGKINASTVRWQPTNDYRITDRDVKDGIDYHTMSWEKRDMDLDDIEAPDNYLLTGVKFRVIGTHLNLEIKVTQFNFTTGLLMKEKSYWHSSDKTIGRSKVNLRDPDISTRSLQPSIIDSRTDQYVEFTHTDFDRDAGQTTVPFIDTQPVLPEIPVPLSGAGIYHKGQIHFGGFVGPKVITYDYMRHLDVVFPEDDYFN